MRTSLSSSTDRYRARFRAVLEFIDLHLDEPLSIERLSSVAAFSKFHFHRQFGELLGMGVYQYVQLTRLQRASYRLAFRDASVLNIAHESGYDGPEAFARAYKKTFSQTPSAFRKNPEWAAWYAIHERLSALRSEHMNTQLHHDRVEIIQFPGAKVATLEHRGEPRRLGDSIRKFIEWRKLADLHPRTSATYNILYDDPQTTAANEYRFDLCAATEDEVASNAYGIVARTIPAGRCASLRVVGGDAAMAQAVRFLYSEWLPNSGEEPGEFPLFLRRESFFPDVPETQQIVTLFLPLGQ